VPLGGKARVPVPNIYLYTFELLVFAIFFLCLRHAWKAGGPAIWQLCAGVVFGLLLEIATIRQLHAYSYGQFAIMIFGAPLGVGLGWGSMIYAARAFSDATNLPEWARPLLDALLALNIDLAMDAVAIRLGMWDWGQGLQDQYFGVPYANYWAWFWVVFSFSAGLRWLVRLPGWVGRWLAPLGALVIGLAGVLFTNKVITFWIPHTFHVIVVAGLLLCALTLVLALRSRRIRPAPRLASLIPLLLHVYFLTAGLLSGAILRPPFLLGISLLMFALALYVHSSRGAPVTSD